MLGFCICVYLELSVSMFARPVTLFPQTWTIVSSWCDQFSLRKTMPHWRMLLLPAELITVMLDFLVSLRKKKTKHSMLDHKPQLHACWRRPERENTLHRFLKSPHWLPVCFRIDFKILLLVYKALNGRRPAHLSDLLLSYETFCWWPFNYPQR